MLTTLPYEILDKILSYLSNKRDLRNSSLVCKVVYNIAHQRIWHHPRFKTFSLKPEDLCKLVTLPIKILETSSLYMIFDKDNTQRYIDIISTMKHVKNVIINSELTPDQLRMFHDLPISVKLNSLDIDSESISEYAEVLSQMQHVKSVDAMIFSSGYRYTSSEFLLLVDLPIKKINTFCFNLYLEGSDIYEFIEIMKNMRYLQEINIDNFPREYMLSPSDLQAFSQIPLHVKVILNETGCLDMNSSNVKDFVHILSGMRQLKSINIEDLYREYPGHKLKPAELKLFCILPVKTISTRVLDIHGANVEEFISVLTDMKLSKDVKIYHSSWFNIPDSVSRAQEVKLMKLAL